MVTPACVPDPLCPNVVTGKADASKLDPGMYTASDIAWNAFGLVGSKWQNFAFDNTPPTLTLSGLLAIANGKQLGAGYQTITATATHGASGVGSLSISLDGKSGITPARGCPPLPAPSTARITDLKLSGTRHAQRDLGL